MCVDQDGQESLGMSSLMLADSEHRGVCIEYIRRHLDVADGIGTQNRSDQ